MNKTARLLLASAALAAVFYGCSSASLASFDSAKDISVVSRENGSGTRIAFIGIFGIEVKSADGGRKDMSTKEAIIKKDTGVLMTGIAGNKYSIGYISLGALNDTIKAVQIEGASASAANIKDGSYPVARPFYIAAKADASRLAKDFISFILSSDGQAVVAKYYVDVDGSALAYSGGKVSGKIIVGGSSSVSPVIEKLKEAYIKINPGVTIEIQQSDSSSGLKGTIDGNFDIGMASRELKDSEKEKLIAILIAVDGIAIIVNKDNPVSNLTKEQVNAIYTGKISKWSCIHQ